MTPAVDRRGRKRLRSPLVGRRQDLETLARHTHEGVALVTIVGAAGVGKTALAECFADRLLDESHAAFGGDVVFCDFANARDAPGVCAVLAQALAVPFADGSRPEAMIGQLGSALAERGPLLVVLDNFEVVVSYASETVRAWLEGAPEAQCLATSRQALGLPGEVVHELAALSLPSCERDVAESEAGQLWIARVKAQRPGWELRPEEAPVLVRLLNRLDGLPLAIELAAARSTVLGPAALLERLDHRFDLLQRSGGPRDRHASLREAIEVSWQLLEAWERAALAQLSVFRGGFSVEAAEAVLDLSTFPDAALAVDTLQSLRAKSLVTTVEPAPGELRLSMYLGIREFAEEKLSATPGAVAAVHERHAEWFARRVERLMPDARRSCGAAVVLLLSIDRDNVGAAIDRCTLAGTAISLERALRILVLLDPLLWTTEPLGDQMARLSAALSSPAAPLVDARLRARALLMRGRLSRLVGREVREVDLEAAAALGRELGVPEVELHALGEIGWLRRRSGRFAEAREVVARMLEVAALSGNRRLEARAHRMCGMGLAAEGRTSEAAPALERALEIARSADDVYEEFESLRGLVTNYINAGRADLARGYAERALAHEAMSRNPWLFSWAALDLAVLEHLDGNLEIALERYRDAEAAARSVGYTEALAPVYAGLVRFEQGAKADAWIRVRDGMARAGSVFPGLAAAFRGFAAAIEASLGRVEEARLELDGLAAESADSIRLCRGHLELAEAERARTRGDQAEAMRSQQAARVRLDEWRASAAEGGPVSFEALLAARWLERALDDALPAPPRDPALLLIVDAEARWFEPPQIPRVMCAHRPVMRRMLLALARARIAHPGRPVCVRDLLEAGWPGERMREDSAKNRLYVMVARLRDLGLRDVLLAREDGYLLDPAVEVRFAAKE